MGDSRLSCGESMMKYLLLFFNVLFFLCGAALLAIGIWMLVDTTLSKYIDLISADNSTNFYRAAAITTIIIGAAIFVIAFLGCCGACKESKCMLGVYAALIIVIIILEIIAAILAGVYNNQLEAELKDTLNEQVREAYNSTDPDTMDQKSITWNFIQQDLKCCGAYNFTDYQHSVFNNNTNDLVPAACCKPKEGVEPDDNPEAADYSACKTEAGVKAAGDTAGENLYVQGCYEGFISKIKNNVWVVVGVAIGVLLFEIIAVIFACCVIRAV